MDPIVIEEQHGFRSGRSTIYSSIVFIAFLTKSLDQKSQIDVFTGFRKVFDMINHGLLIKVLESFGIDNPLLTWINWYFTNRSYLLRFLIPFPN